MTGAVFRFVDSWKNLCRIPETSLGNDMDAPIKGAVSEQVWGMLSFAALQEETAAH